MRVVIVVILVWRFVRGLLVRFRALAGPGFLLLLLALGNMVVARGTFSENMAKAAVVSVEFLSWIQEKLYNSYPGRACMKGRWGVKIVTVSRFLVIDCS